VCCGLSWGLLPRRADYADRTAAATDRARGPHAAQPDQQVMVVTPTAELSPTRAERKGEL